MISKGTHWCTFSSRTFCSDIIRPQTAPFLLSLMHIFEFTADLEVWPHQPLRVSCVRAQARLTMPCVGKQSPCLAPLLLFLLLVIAKDFLSQRENCNRFCLAYLVLFKKLQPFQSMVVGEPSQDAFCNFWLRREAAPRGPQQRAATSLQDAIDSLPDGSALELPPGQYQNTKPILIQRNITLLGSSGTRTQLSGSFVFEVGAEKAVLQDVDVVNEGRFVAVHLRCAGQPRVQGRAEAIQNTDPRIFMTPIPPQHSAGCRVQSRGIGILADPPLNTDSAPCVVDCRIGPAWQGLVIAGRCKGIC